MLRAFKVLEAANGATGDALGMLALSPATGQHGYRDTHEIKKSQHTRRTTEPKPGKFASGSYGVSDDNRKSKMASCHS